MKITLVAGARPNFMKIASIVRAIDNSLNSKEPRLLYEIVHTGQHYDTRLSRVFFEELGLPEPTVNLGSGSGTQAEQTAKIMVGFEKYLAENLVDLVLVVGDVTSTMACSIVAKKMGIKVAHVEAGIRSFDMTMPEEVNRVVTDSLSDFFFTTTEMASQNLVKTGVPASKIFLVGNTMIDTLLHSLPKISLSEKALLESINLTKGRYFVLTLHRPFNVDLPENLDKILSLLNEHNYKIVFPVHPRTAVTMQRISRHYQNILAIEPQSYFNFISLLKNSRGAITDSGGIQEETTVLGIPCVTLRPNTERPETVTIGTNELVGDDLVKLNASIQSILNEKWKLGTVPPLWDGHSGKRIVDILKSPVIDFNRLNSKKMD
jgi:UDP-N-acetylglucosamine 2-epimerase (non-hydrolysing)